MFLVLPVLGRSPEIYAFYSLILSLTIVLTYSDLGFVNALQREATNAFARGDTDEESKIYSVTAALLVAISLLFVFGIKIYFDLFFDDSKYLQIDQSVVLNMKNILIFILPISIVLQRLVQMMLLARVNEVKFLKFDSLFNFLKLLVLFVFLYLNVFRLDYYWLVITIVSIIGYSILAFQNVIKLVWVKQLDVRRIVRTSWKLSGSGFVGSLVWLLIFEMDILIVSTTMGISALIFYAPASQLLNFAKKYYNVLFAPLANRLILSYDKGEMTLGLSMTNLWFTIILPLTFGAFTILFFTGDIFFDVWMGSIYAESFERFKPFIMILLITPFMHLTSAMFYSSRSYSQLLYVNLLGLVVFLSGNMVISTDYGFAYVKAFSILSIGTLSVIFCYKNLKEVIKMSLIYETLFFIAISVIYCLLIEGLQIRNIWSLLFGLFFLFLITLILTFRKNRFNKQLLEKFG